MIVWGGVNFIGFTFNTVEIQSQHEYLDSDHYCECAGYQNRPHGSLDRQ